MRTASRSALGLFTLSFSALGIFAVDAARAQAAMPMPQVWTGTIAAPEGVHPGLTADKFELRIFTATTDNEIGDLVGELRVGGQDGLRRAMFRQKPRGWIRIGKLAATDLVCIRVADLEDGRRRVRVYSDHALRLYDKTDPVGVKEHPFGYLELIADSSGNGTGTLIAAASISIGDDGFRIESAGLPVMQVNEVTTDKPPAGH